MLALKKLRQKDPKSEASLDYTVISNPALDTVIIKILCQETKRKKKRENKTAKQTKVSGRKTEKNNEEDWCCSSVVKHLPSMHKVLEVYQECFMN